MCISLNKAITVWWCQMKKLIVQINVHDLLYFNTMEQQSKIMNVNEN